ncbi:NadR type nicotinamide-nucleotide adenylyltransferase [Orbus hercynius]|uniref:NadR type nicotinamide-nucleotide adenylyltransferase n=1 Tax=Orbus hercynius TaxID=593135 RepID=A0A495RCP7_9GAMM|nr:multifunctional transcriptional regulator/nicotinamide-nucleotide adenylyltransferase/ribosylnicotinamide kinase NadR [Orbus hercynius]RKS85060.1 NadR type nicotinamide-nucleotide adenylyltransferase [Orbus hercynius]
MISFNYLKAAIKRKGVSLQTVANACGMTKGYLSQLINDKVKRPSAQKLEVLHRYLKLDYPVKDKKVGIIFGKFYPLHTGHINLIQRAISQVDELYIILCSDTKRDEALFLDSAMSRQPTINDRMRWLLQTFKYQKNIHIELLEEDGIPAYPHGWNEWSERAKALFKDKGIEPNCVYSSEPQDAEMYKNLFNLHTILVDPERHFMNVSSTNIRQAPLKNWQYIPTEVRPFFVRTVAILGGESSGKSTLINKLANVFNTTSAWEFGREYVFSHLGGDERALQFSDYDKIALGQAQYIDFAIKYANRVAFIDTDFITTQAFCKKYEGKEHPFVQAMINNYRFDLVILLENNTPWVADGLRHLGNTSQRKDFQQLLITMLKKNHVKFVTITSPDYDERYLACIDLVKQLINHQDI